MHGKVGQPVGEKVEGIFKKKKFWLIYFNHAKVN